MILVNQNIKRTHDITSAPGEALLGLSGWCVGTGDDFGFSCHYIVHDGEYFLRKLHLADLLKISTQSVAQNNNSYTTEHNSCMFAHLHLFLVPLLWVKATKWALLQIIGAWICLPGWLASRCAFWLHFCCGVWSWELPLIDWDESPNVSRGGVWKMEKRHYQSKLKVGASTTLHNLR